MTPVEGIAADRVDAAAFVLSLRARGVFDRGVLRALETVPREAYAPRQYADLARADLALPLPCGQTMTSPTVVAQMLAVLAPEPGHHVLEVGTGSGWVSALLAKLGCTVLSHETRAVLCERARARLDAAGVGGQVEISETDGLESGPSGDEVDRILLNGSLPEEPVRLAERLRPGGRLVGALTSGGMAPRLLSMVRSTDGALTADIGVSIRIAPLVVSK